MKVTEEHCDETGGRVTPVVDFNKCGAKTDCVVKCPFELFELREITPEDKLGLNLVGKLKTFFDQRKAYVVDPDLCHACGLCVTECPEKAIKLRANLKK